MAIQEQRPMNRTSITVVIVVLLCAASFAYSQGWLDWSRPSREVIESKKANVRQELEIHKASGDGVPVTPQATESLARPTK
jgi:hypothetical protein